MHPLPMRRNRYAALPALAALLAAVALLPGCPAIIGAGALGAFTALEDRRTTGTQIEDQGIESRAATRIAVGRSRRRRREASVLLVALLLGLSATGVRVGVNTLVVRPGQEMFGGVDRGRHDDRHHQLAHLGGAAVGEWQRGEAGA